MRIGASFARGSCRALTWMVALGVVFTLGAGSAAAQTIKSVTIAGADSMGRVMEGTTTSVMVTLMAKATEDVPVRVVLPGGYNDGRTGKAEPEDLRLNYADRLDNMNDLSATGTILMGQTSIAFTLEIEEDPDAVDEMFQVQGVIEGMGADAVREEFKIVDDEEQMYKLDLVGKPEAIVEDEPFMVKLYADPARPMNEDKELYLILDGGVADRITGNMDPPYGMTHEMGTPDSTVDITITPAMNDRDRVHHDITVDAFMFDGSPTTQPAWPSGMYSYTVHDVDMLPTITAKVTAVTAPGEDGKDVRTVVKTGDTVESVDEGDNFEVELTATWPKGAMARDDVDVKLMLSGMADMTDVDVDPRSLDIELDHEDKTMDKNGQYMLTASLDFDVDEDMDVNDEMFMLDAMVMGTPMFGRESHTDPGILTLTFMDTTPLNITPMSDEAVMKAVMDARMMADGDGDDLWTADGGDEDVMIAIDKLFGGVMAGYRVTSDASSSDDKVAMASADANVVTIKPMATGTAMITVSANVAMSGAGMQISPNAAEVMFSVTVDGLPLEVTSLTVDHMEIMEGGSAMVTVMTNRDVTMDTKYMLEVVGDKDAHDMFGGMPEITIETGMHMGSATLMATEDDDYMDETLTVIATGPGIEDTMMVEIMVTDNDEAPVDPPTVSAKSQEQVDAVFAAAIADARSGMEWYEGGAAAMVDMSALFDVMEGASPAYAGTSSNEMVVSATSHGMMLSLMPMADGMATITVTAAASGDVATAESEVMVADLPLEVTVMAAADMVEEGHSVMVTATANKMVDANTEVMLMRDGASSAGMDDYSLEPSLITIMAGEMSGSLMLMATDDHDVEGNESLTLNAMVGDMAAGMVMVTITDNDMDATYTLSGPMDMNLVEGMEYEITATASQAVLADTEVMLMRDGTSTAGMDDFSVESIMIMAGETMGSTMLMVTEDNMADSGSGHPEVLVIYGTVDGMNVGSLQFNLWDAAVPALPVLAQLLLAAFLAVGGYRRYLRR